MRGRRSNMLVAGVAVCAAVVAVPLMAQPVFCPDGGTVQNCAAWADINGNRQYNPGTDELLPLTLSGSALTIGLPSAWGCGTPVVQLSSEDTLYDQGMFGRYIGSITDFDNSGHPFAFSLSGEGTAALMDRDGDGCYDQIDARLASGGVYVQTGLDFLDTNGDGEPEFVSADWTYASLYGMGGDCGPGTDAQIWLPMDNNQFVPGWANTYTSGCLRQLAPNVPTLTEWGVLLLGVGMLAFGWWLLRRRQALA